MPQAPPPAGHQAEAPQTHSLLPSLPGAVPADHRGRLLSKRSAVVFGTSSFWLQLCFVFWARLWLWYRGCRPLYGKGPQQSGRVLSPAVPYSAWARESCTLLAARLPRAKGSGRGAALSGRAQRPTGRRSLGQASPTCRGGMVNGPVCRVALLHEGGGQGQEGAGHSAAGSVSAPPASAGGPAVAREWVLERGPRCPHTLPTAGPECSESSQGVTSWHRRLPELWRAGPLLPR